MLLGLPLLDGCGLVFVSTAVHANHLLWWSHCKMYSRHKCLATLKMISLIWPRQMQYELNSRSHILVEKKKL